MIRPKSETELNLAENLPVLVLISLSFLMYILKKISLEKSQQELKPAIIKFFKIKQEGSMMMLKGQGDPSFGYGGYSFLKMPLKIS